MNFCMAATATWALIFADPPGDSVTMEPHAVSCFTKKTDCEMVAMAANSGFELDLSPHRAMCQEQPAVPTDAQGGLTYWNPNGH